MKKIVGFLLILILVLLVLFFLVLPLVVSQSNVQSFLISQIKERVSDDFEVEAVGFGFFPSAFLQAEGFSLPLSEDSSNDSVVKVGRAKLFLKLYPLLFKRLEVKHVQVKDVSVYYELTQEKDKKLQWIRLSEVEGSLKNLNFETPSRFKLKGKFLNFDTPFEIKGDVLLSLSESKLNLLDLNVRYEMGDVLWKSLKEAGWVESEYNLDAMRLAPQGSFIFDGETRDVSGEASLDIYPGFSSQNKKSDGVEISESITVSTQFVWSQQNKEFSFSDSVIQGPGLSGGGKGTLQWKETPEIDTTIRLRSINFDLLLPYLPAKLLEKIKHEEIWVASGESKVSFILKGPLDNLLINIDANLSDTQMQVYQIWKKPKDYSFSINLQSYISKSSLKDTELNLRFGDLTVKGVSNDYNFKQKTGSFNLTSNKCSLSSLNGLLLPNRELELGGEVKVVLNLKGDLTESNKLTYNSHSTLENVSIKHGKDLLVKNFSGTFDIDSNNIALQELKLQLKDSEINVNGKMIDFSAPNFELDVQSPKVVLDDFEALSKAFKKLSSDLLVAPKPSSPIKVVKHSLFQESIAYAQPVSASPTPSLIAAAKTNIMPVIMETLKKAQGDIKLTVDKIWYRDRQFRELNGLWNFAVGDVDIRELNIKVGPGMVTVSGLAGLNSATPRYSLNVQSTQVPIDRFLKEKIVTGLLEASFFIQGELGSREQIEKTMIGQGTFNLSNGEIYAMSFMDVLMKAPNALNDLTEKLIKKKKLTDPTFLGDFNFTVFDSISGQCQIADRLCQFSILNVSSDKLNVELRGIVDFDENVDFQGYAQINEGFLSLLGSQVGDTATIKVPITVKGPLSKPKVSYSKSAVGKTLLKRALGNIIGKKEDGSSKSAEEIANSLLSSLLG